jgi:hypothetical protein
MYLPVCGVGRKHYGPTDQRIGIFRDGKGTEYMSTEFDKFPLAAGIRREHSIRDTPQQPGVAKHLNRSIAEGITISLSQSGLTRTHPPGGRIPPFTGSMPGLDYRHRPHSAILWP